jgi:hypothetical protein
VHGVLAVPVRVDREVKAVLYGMARTMDPLGDRVLDTAAAVAASVGRELAVELEVARRTRSCSRSRQPPRIRCSGNACCGCATARRRPRLVVPRRC